MPTRGGTFRQIGSLQSRATSQGTMGGQVATWNPAYATVYVAIQPLNGRELLAAQAVQSGVTHQVMVAWSPNFTPKASDRLVVGARVFDIKAVWNEDEANRVWVMQAVEGMTQG